MMDVTELRQVQEAIRDVAEELAGMIGKAPDPAQRLPRSEWTVAETAAHLALAQKGMGQIATGAIANPYAAATISDFASINAHYLQTFPERDPAFLANLITEGTEEFLGTLGALPDSRPVPSPMGEMDVTTLYVYNLAHLLMHGHPLAEALGKPSPVTRKRALLVVPFMVASVPKVFDKAASGDLAACLEIRMRRGPRFFITIDSGTCWVETLPSRRVDCHISADPAAFFLVSAGVVSQWGPIARGKLTAWGRKPWLSLRLKSLLPNP